MPLLHIIWPQAIIKWLNMNEETRRNQTCNPNLIIRLKPRNIRTKNKKKNLKRNQ